MKTLFKIALLLTLILVTTSFAQTEVGKIFTDKEAATLFGGITQEKEIPLGTFQKFLNESDNCFLVTLSNNQVYFASSGRTPIYPVNQKSYPVNYFKFSKSKVQELINLNPNGLSVKIQLRNNVLTIQNGENVLELSLICPPYCF